jgi:hypothetical protein
MRKIESIEDRKNRVVTYEMPDGTWVRLDAGAVENYGLWEMLRVHGYEPPTERVSVMQYGKCVGTLPGDFDPELMGKQPRDPLACRRYNAACPTSRAAEHPGRWSSARNPSSSSMLTAGSFFWSRTASRTTSRMIAWSRTRR